MKQLIRKILKEETEKNDLTKIGIDISVKMLKQTYPYITGWRYNDEWESKFGIGITLICDIKKVCEYYNSDLKPYHKNYEDEIKKNDYAYPFSILEISETMGNDDKFLLWKELRDVLNDTYDLIPEEYKIMDRWGDFKNLDPDYFEFI